MICIPIVSQEAKAALSDLKKAEAIADVIELRLDVVPREVWSCLFREARKPLILTLRSIRQGGRFEGDEASRIEILRKTLKERPAFIDLEWDTPRELFEQLKRERDGTRLIVSFHDFERTPDDLEGIWRKLDSLEADLMKVVTYANNLADNIKILQLAQNHSKKTIAFCMGPVGIPSRILTLRYGGLLTFGSLEPGKESALGQIPAQELIEIYRVREIRPETQIFGLVGNPISHSLSPFIHNQAFKHLGIDAVYIPFETAEVRTLLKALQWMTVQGFSVTLPHKQAIFPLLDEVDRKANVIGAVNTVCRKGNRWLGYNTDVEGAWKAMEGARIDLKNKQWTLFGAGGVARAVAYAVGARRSPRSLTFLGRSPERLAQIANDMARLFTFPIRSASFSQGDVKRWSQEADILVNCTPVGMAGNSEEEPIPTQYLVPSQAIFDTVYNPPETKLLREGKARGCRTISGLEMFLLQGAAQFELWTGRRAPLGLMREKALEKLGK